MANRSDELRRREKMETPLTTLIDLFTATKRIEGKSPKTIAWYTDFLRKYQEFIGEGGTVKDVNMDSARPSWPTCRTAPPGLKPIL